MVRRVTKRAADGSSGTAPSKRGIACRVRRTLGGAAGREELTGLVLMCAGAGLGWPAVGVIGWLSIRWRSPMLLGVGVPSALVSGHLLFAAGLYLAGGRRIAATVRRLRSRR